MKNILVLGAGRSSSSLINYLLSNSIRYDWNIVVGDVSLSAAQQKIGNSRRGSAVIFDIADTESGKKTIQSADVVISLIPANLHPSVAKICLELKKHLLTASYVSDEMRSYSDQAKSNGLLFLNESGLDPGIDHMSAMQVIDRIREEGGKLTSFESFTGGLIAPETDPENPWRYKFTWNPRNVVLAGQGTARFLQNGQYKYISYQQLFKRITPVHVEGYGEYEGYANRDSLKYIDTYGLQGIQTMLRGTLRNKGYCASWNIFVQLGCCDDTYEMEDVAQMSHRMFLNSFLDFHPSQPVEQKLSITFNIDPEGPEIKRLRWSGLFDNDLIGLEKGTPARILEHILNKKWRLQTDDKDLVVMWHRFVYTVNNNRKEIQASLVAKGDTSVNTAMAKTVGLPLGIAARLLLEDKIKARGVVTPISKEIYEPVLLELKELGIELTEKHFLSV